MNDETVHCLACGNLMLLRTADRNAGKCIPCAKGYRDEIEEGKRTYAQQMRLQESPDAKYWRNLCDRVDNPAMGFSSLPNPEKALFAICLLEGEVYNGGFEQYFTNSYSDHIEFALRGLETMGDDEGLRMIKAAQRILFGETKMPSTNVERYVFLEENGFYLDETAMRYLKELDSKFVEHYEESLSEKLRHFAIKHELMEIDTSSSLSVRDN